jgi:hypothetical protein
MPRLVNNAVAEEFAPRVEYRDFYVKLESSGLT